MKKLLTKELITECPPEWISLHDAHITGIKIGKGNVKFLFGEGLDYIHDGMCSYDQKGMVIAKTEAENIRCMVYRRKPSKTGLKIKGREIFLKKLKSIIDRENWIPEIIDEKYSAEEFYWRGELIPENPKKVKGFFPGFVLTGYDCKELQFVFDESGY